MFGIVRIIICVLILALLVFLFEHIIKKKTICIVLSGVIVTTIFFAFAFIPFENKLFDFDSPEAAYRYYNNNYEVKLVVSGQISDMVVGHKRGNIYNHLIVPKSDQGWNIGISINTKRINRIRQDNLYVDVYQYKDTDDYYISISDLYGGSLDVTDVYSTKFIELLEVDETSGEDKFLYYAQVKDFNEDYYIIVNGEVVAIGQGTVPCLDN